LSQLCLLATHLVYQISARGSNSFLEILSKETQVFPREVPVVTTGKTWRADPA
jgi:hypothetical protein